MDSDVIKSPVLNASQKSKVLANVVAVAGMLMTVDEECTHPGRRVQLWRQARRHASVTFEASTRLHCFRHPACNSAVSSCPCSSPIDSGGQFVAERVVTGSA